MTEKFDTLLEERLHRGKAFHLRLQVGVASNYYLHLMPMRRCSK